MSHLDLLGYTRNMNAYKFANSSQSTVEIDLEEDTATSLTSNLSTDIVSRFFNLKHRAENFISFFFIKK